MREHSKSCRRRTWMSAAAVAACVCAPAMRRRQARVAALQVALGAWRLRRHRQRYRRPGTTPACADSRLARTGGRRHRRAAHTPRAGAAGPPSVGSRPSRRPIVDGTSPRLQFALETHGFPCGRSRRLRRPHRTPPSAAPGLRRPAGRRRRRSGHNARRALRPTRRAPRRLRLPIDAPVGDRYGPRGSGVHAGLDIPAASGTRVTAAAAAASRSRGGRRLGAHGDSRHGNGCARATRTS